MEITILLEFTERQQLRDWLQENHTTDKECYGLCKAEKVLFITTRGMNISTGDPLEQATPYIKALSHLWGWGELTVVAAQNMDYSSAEGIEDRIKAAVAEGLEICKVF